MALINIASQPGVQRDGTLFDGKAYTEAVWTRFYRGRPKKMGGFKELVRSFPEIGRGMQVDTVNNFAYVHVGSQSFLRRSTLDILTGLPTGVVDRTPAAFPVSANNLWQFDSAFDVGTNKNYILAHAAPNMTNIANTTANSVYFGDVTDVAALTAIASSSVSGGVCVLHPYAIIYGSDGYLAWSVPAAPTNFTGVGSGAARPQSAKIVKGMPLRAGPGSSPAGLFWGLDSLSRLMFVGGSSIFTYDTISTASSVFSAASIIEHNGVYYWPSTAGFLMFNGVLQEVPNSYNQAWFYKNVNMTYAQKAYATKIPLWGEIWFCFPRGSATECNHAVVLNYRDKIWYDTPLPGNGRSCAAYQQVFPYPLMVDAGLNSSGTVSLWQHEVGVDEVSGAIPQTLAIKSSFRTGQIAAIMASQQGPGQDRSISVQLVEPDFNQIGDMTMSIYGAPNAAMKTPVLLATAPVAQPNTGTIDETPGVNVTQRLLQFDFESNVAGGDFEMGNVIAHVEDGDDRYTA